MRDSTGQQPAKSVGITFEDVARLALRRACLVSRFHPLTQMRMLWLRKRRRQRRRRRPRSRRRSNLQARVEPRSARAPSVGGNIFAKRRALSPPFDFWGGVLLVTACDKREALAQGSDSDEAIARRRSGASRSSELRCAIAHLRSGPSDHPGMTEFQIPPPPDSIFKQRPSVLHLAPLAGRGRELPAARLRCPAASG